MIGQILATFTLIRTSFKKSPVPLIIGIVRIKMKALLERVLHKLSHAHINLVI